MRFTICATLLLSGLYAPAQVLLIPASEVDDAELHFNPAFIQRNRVASITGVHSVKRDNEPMRERKDRSLYRFDEIGRTVYANNSYGRPGTGTDTASITYGHDASGRVVQRMRNDLNGHYALDLELDSAGRPLRETYTRIENLGTDRYHLVPGARTVISDEQFAYATVNDTAWRKTFRNNLGLPYREQTWSRDHWGYLRAIEDLYLVSGRRARTTFRYDEKGHLAERVEQADLGDPRTAKHTWRYDATGNVTEHDAWREDRQVKHEEFLYEEGSMLLKATITKDMDTGLIHVVRYHTERR